jgi:hypothetical protein
MNVTLMYYTHTSRHDHYGQHRALRSITFVICLGWNNSGSISNSCRSIIIFVAPHNCRAKRGEWLRRLSTIQAEENAECEPPTIHTLAKGVRGATALANAASHLNHTHHLSVHTPSLHISFAECIELGTISAVREGPRACSGVPCVCALYWHAVNPDLHNIHHELFRCSVAVD